MKRRNFAHIVTAVLMASVMACATSPDEETLDSGDMREGYEGSGSGSITGSRVPEIESKLADVYFDFDSWTIREDSKGTLKRNAEILMELDSGVLVTVEGHCDERGSEEYNLALGEKRSNSVKRYLTALGVPSARLSVVSFGEEQPAVQGHDESAWRWNRRAGFDVSR